MTGDDDDDDIEDEDIKEEESNKGVKTGRKERILLRRDSSILKIMLMAVLNCLAVQVISDVNY